MARSWMVVLVIFVLLLTVLLAMHRGGEAAPAPATVAKPTYSIIPGVGLSKCSIGMPIQRARDLFGKEDKKQSLFENDEDGYLIFYKQGVDIYVDGGKLDGIIFYFRDKEHMTFDGSTDKGIGMWSTIPDVIRAYGKPSRISEYTHDRKSGHLPGVHEWSIDYLSLGITFTFYDNELGDIRVFSRQ